MMPSRSTTRRRHLKSRALALGFLAFGISGCDLDRVSDAEAIRLSDPVYRHPIAVEAHKARVDLPVGAGRHDGHASAYLEATKFIRQYRRDSRGPLTIAYSRHGGHEGRLVDGVRQIAAQNGVPSRAIRMVERRDGVHSVTLSYDAVIAKGPECGDWSENAARHPSLTPMPIFGCASRRNLAHMVAEPTDLLFPQSETVRGSERRGDTYRTYSDPKGSGSASSSGGGGASAANGPNAATPTQ